MIQVTVLYFAALREQMGQTQQQINVATGTTIGALFEQLFPPGSAGSWRVGYAINREQVPADTVLSNADEVAFLPPLGGG